MAKFKVGDRVKINSKTSIKSGTPFSEPWCWYFDNKICATVIANPRDDRVKIEFSPVYSGDHYKGEWEPKEYLLDLVSNKDTYGTV